MLDAPEIAVAEARQTAVVRFSVPRAEIGAVVGPAIAEVGAALVDRRIVPAGPWFAHHLRRPTDTADFEVGVPVAAPFTAAGRVRPGRLPGGPVARAVHRGDYAGLAAAWAELEAWLAARGHRPAPNLWEFMRVGTASSPDSVAWRTELNRPLEGTA